MILVRAPLRISFVGGGTDLPAFYRRYPGRVVSTTIDKYVYLAINHTPLIDRVSARYSLSETVTHPDELQHTRIKAALNHLGIVKNIEIGSFASLPAKTGLGSSSSFSVALVKGLHAFQGKKLGCHEAAEAACNLEINLVGEPIGKQDQYAASLGGLNHLQFNTDDSVTVEPILLDYKKRLKFENHCMLFFTGITRSAGDVLRHQGARVDDHLETYKQMSDSTFDFRDKLLGGDIQGMAAMLHEGWLRKKSLSSKVSNSLIEDMYTSGLNAGAWGGKILGAGGGGCLLFMAPPDKQEMVRKALFQMAGEHGLEEFKEIPFHFTQTGTDVLLNYHTSLV